MRYLVTGAAGFIGSHLSERILDGGDEVVGVDSFTEAYDPALKEANAAGLIARDGFRLIRGDLAELGLDPLLEGVEVVFHLAAQAGVGTSWGGNFDQYLRRNALATQRLLEACKAKPLRRFIYASSSSIYGDSEIQPTPEKTLPRPHSPYGVTKLAAEHLCHLYWRNHGVPAVSLRYFTVYGPRQRPDMAFHRFLKALWTGQPLTLYGDGRQSRDFTYVSDVVEASMMAAASAPPGAVYNIGGGVRATLQEALQIMETVTSRKPRVISREKEHGDVRHTWADLSRARRELGYDPRVPLKEGLRRESEWLQGHL